MASAGLFVVGVSLADMCACVSVLGASGLCRNNGTKNGNVKGNRNTERSDKLQRLYAYLMSLTNELHP